MKARDDKKDNSTKIIQIPWYIPKLTSDEGNPSFKILSVSSSNDSLYGDENWMIFKGNGGYKASYRNEKEMYQRWFFYSSIPLQLKNFELDTFRLSDKSKYSPAKKLTWLGSNDRFNWYTLFYNDGYAGVGHRYYDVNNNTSYHYLIFEIWNTKKPQADEIAFRNFYFNATQPAIIDGGRTLKVPYLENNYKGIYDV